MADGTVNGVFTSWKTIGIAITASIGISGISMSIMSDRISSQTKMLGGLSDLIEAKTRNSYTEDDARRDFQTANERMHRIEQRDISCEVRLNEHLERHNE